MAGKEDSSNALKLSLQMMYKQGMHDITSLAYSKMIDVVTESFEKLGDCELLLTHGKLLRDLWIVLKESETELMKRFKEEEKCTTMPENTQ